MWLVALSFALLSASTRAVTECFRPRTPSEFVAAIAPLGERNSSSSLRVCLDDADDECASSAAAAHTPISEISVLLFLLECWA